MPKTELKLEFLGTSGVNSFVANVSSPRAIMDNSHFSSHIPLINPDSKVVKSGIEYELGKYINHCVVENDCIVKAIIPRYKEYGIVNIPTYTLLVEYEENNELYLDYINVDTYVSNHTFFGYELKETDDLFNLTYNSVLNKDTILSKANSFGKDGDYKYGLNANIAFMSHPSVAEDGFVVSESFLQRAKFTSIIKRVINITKDTIPINLYGDNNIYKFIPNIGENVRPDGLLCALRQRNDWFSISDLNVRNLSEPDLIFDNLTYVNPNSKVIDIKVIRGNYGKKEYTDKITEQLDQYAEMLVNYYRNVIKSYENYFNEKKQIYGNIDSIKLTPKMHRFITDCYIKVDIGTSTKHKLCYRKVPIDQYRIEITTINTITPNIGFKITDLHAAKGVICKILPDECMPVDKNGNRADIITDSMATISRMNLGRAYEAYLGAVSRDCRQHLIKVFSNKKQITEEDIIYFYNYIKGLYTLINNDMVEFIDSLNKDELINHLREILTDNLYIYYPPDNEYNITDVISNIENSIYKPINDKVKYIDEFNRLVETKDNVRIGNLYIMFLEKIASTYNAVSSSKVNNFGFPIKGSNSDKVKYLHNLTPTKIFGETEIRILTSFMGKEAIGDLIDITLNPVSHKFIIKNILENDKAFDVNFDVDRNMVEYGQTKSLAILTHMFNAAGFNFEYEE